MNRWFISDPHFGDEEIIGFCNRPFKNAEKMNKRLIGNWNSRVKPDDEVIMLGDWCMEKNSKYWENKLNGKIIYIEGNHDRNNHTNAIIRSMNICYGNKNILLLHNPEDIRYNTTPDIVFCGHVHTAWEITRFRIGFDFVDCINIGVDVWKYRPVSFNEIMVRYTKWLKTKELI